MFIKPSTAKKARPGSWVKGGNANGLCFTIAPRHLETILRTGKLPEVYQKSWKLKPDEFIEKLGFATDGITVYIGFKPDDVHSVRANGAKA